MTMSPILQKNLYKTGLIALNAAALVACQSTPDTAAPPINKPSSLALLSNGHLTARDLAPGECGLFVWAEEARRFILFTQSGRNAVLAKDGQEVPLTALPSDDIGDLYGQIPVQKFRDSDNITYSLTLTNEETIDGGIRYSSGTWRYQDKAGWDVLRPAYGLSTCKALS